MIKLKATDDKDLFVQVLDILEFQGIKTRRIEEFDEYEGKNSVMVYTVFVNEENLEEAKTLLAEYLQEPPKPEEIEYGGVDKEKLLDELVYNVKNEQQRENIMTELKERGISEKEIQQNIVEELKAGYKQEHMTDFKEIMFRNGFWLALRMYSSKKEHPVTHKKFYEYDDESRRAAFILLIFYAFMISFIVFYLIYFLFMA